MSIIDINFKTKEDRDSFVKRFFFLAYTASSVVGMGFLQAVDDMTEDFLVESLDKERPYIDYGAGRMMKVGLWLDTDTSAKVYSGEAREGYQSWAWKYPTYEALIEATKKSLGEAVYG